MVKFALPPPTGAIRPSFRTLKAGTQLVRLFNPTIYGATATSFRYYGPLLRFDHHRAPVDAQGVPQPDLDPQRGVYYAAHTLSGCIVEIFGDSGLITPGDWQIAYLEITHNLKLLNLQGSGAMRAGSVAVLAKHPDHNLAQAWSRFFYDTPTYRQVAGLWYKNAHNDEAAVLLYERALPALHCPAAQTIALDDPALRPALLQIARKNNLVCAL